LNVYERKDTFRKRACKKGGSSRGSARHGRPTEKVPMKKSESLAKKKREFPDARSRPEEKTAQEGNVHVVPKKRKKGTKRRGVQNAQLKGGGLEPAGNSLRKGRQKEVTRRSGHERGKKGPRPEEERRAPSSVQKEGHGKKENCFEGTPKK